MDDRALVEAEIARLDAVQPGDGFERAFVRRICLQRLGFTHAAAVLRQEALLTLDPGTDNLWYGPDAPPRTWHTECNRLYFVAGVAGLTDYRLPEPHEILHLVRARREQRTREAGGEFKRWW